MDPDQTAPTSGSTLFDKVGPNILNIHVQAAPPTSLLNDTL